MVSKLVVFVVATLLIMSVSAQGGSRVLLFNAYTDENGQPTTTYPPDQLDIFTLDLDTGELVNLTNTPNQNEYAPHWLPDGDHIVFSRTDRESGYSDVFRMNADGTNAVNLTNTGDINESVLSVSGMGVVSIYWQTSNSIRESSWLDPFTGEQTEGLGWRISPDGTQYVRLGEGKAKLIDTLSGDVVMELGFTRTYSEFSPDGEQIAYSRWPPRYSFNDSLHVQDLRTGEIRVLYQDRDYKISGFQWAPDSRRIAFVPMEVYLGPGPALATPIHIVDVLTGEIQQLEQTEGTGATNLMDWSPDGEYIAYVCAIGICVVNGETGEFRVAKDNITSADPKWRPR
jgi:Tol biopolymer transport system component